jgi:hypothetical protein
MLVHFPKPEDHFQHPHHQVQTKPSSSEFLHCSVAKIDAYPKAQPGNGRLYQLVLSPERIRYGDRHSRMAKWLLSKIFPYS